MPDDIRDLMEGWARYRHFRHGGFGKTILQRVMEGMPGTHCPTCAGRGRAPGAIIGRKGTFIACPTCGGSGRVKLDETDHALHTRACPHCRLPGERESRGEINGRTCFHCRGSGWLTRETDKVNPAFITSTFREPDHPTFQRIDRLVCELRRRHALLSYYFAVWYEYCDSRGGTQQMKANRCGCNYSAYKMRLSRALDWVELALPDKRPAPEIPFPYVSQKKVLPKPENSLTPL